MPTYKIAHISSKHFDMVVFPVVGSFGSQTPDEQTGLIEIFQAKSKASGFKGNVVVVWDGEGEKVYFRAPPHQQEYFQNVTSAFIDAHLNKTISW